MKNIKKKLLLGFIVLSMTITGLFTQEDILLVKKGDIVKTDGYWFSKPAAELMLKNGKLVQDMSADIKSLKFQLATANDIIIEKDYMISRLNIQIASYVAMEKTYKAYIKEIESAMIQNRILVIVGGIGWGIAGGSLIGIASYAALRGTGVVK